ncbi:MAG: shikimate kinase [Pseudomonadota bacterium]
MRNIILIGPMGAGKTTIGRILAGRLGWTFSDSDREIEKRTGASIPLIFEIEGESGFRRREHDMLAHLTSGSERVVATGGGAVLRPENRTLLRENGWVVYLYTPVERQFERTQHDTQRPLLQNGDRRATLKRLMDERDPLYRETAHLVIETGGQPPRGMADRILNAWHARDRNSNDA